LCAYRAFILVQAIAQIVVQGEKQKEKEKDGDKDNTTKTPNHKADRMAKHGLELEMEHEPELKELEPVENGFEHLTEAQIDRLVKRLRQKRRRRTSHVPEKVTGNFSRLQPKSQRHKMHPTLRILVETTKAMEQYNEHARTETRRLTEISHNLDDDEKAADKQPTAARKLTSLGRVKRGTLLRLKPTPKPDAATEALRRAGQKDSSKQLTKLRTRRGKSTTLRIQHKSNTAPIKVVRFPMPQHLLQQRPSHPLMGPPMRSLLRLPHLPPQSALSSSNRSPIATIPLNPSKPVLTTAIMAPLAGGSVVDRLRDPRLRGRPGI
jgi:hypothetical protein